MITRIFFDIDSTLIYTDLSDPEQDHIKFYLIDDARPYYTIIRPSAKKLIDFARNLVGFDNVYILTSAIKEYAEIINDKAGFGFEKDRIFAREDMEHNTYYTAYSGSACLGNESILDKDNVLIDDLPFRYNVRKMSFIGIDSSRYLNIEPYYGVNNREEEFFGSVCEFLKEKYYE